MATDAGYFCPADVTMSLAARINSTCLVDLALIVLKEALQEFLLLQIQVVLQFISRELLCNVLLSACHFEYEY